MKEEIGFSGVVAGRAVGFLALLTAPEVAGRCPIHIATDIEIEPAIAIIVEPGAACAHPAAGDMGLRAPVGKAASRFAMEKEILAPAGDIDVRESIIIVVAHAAADRMSGDIQPGLLRDVHKALPAFVVIENYGTLRRFRSRTAGQGSAAEQQDVLPAIAIVIQEGAAGAKLLHEQLAPAPAVPMYEGEAK